MEKRNKDQNKLKKRANVVQAPLWAHSGHSSRSPSGLEALNGRYTTLTHALENKAD